MSEVTNPNVTSDDEGHARDCKAVGVGAHEFATLHRRSLDNSINGLRRRRRRKQIIKKSRRAFCIVGAAGLCLSNAPPSVMAQPIDDSNKLQFTLADIKYEAISNIKSPPHEEMIRRCRSRIDGSIISINDVVRSKYSHREVQHVVTDLFYIDDHNSAVVTMFQVKNRDGFFVMNEVRASLALPSCAVTKISFGLI